MGRCSACSCRFSAGDSGGEGRLVVVIPPRMLEAMKQVPKPE
jgi:hypothetical protein